ncbi:MAG: hypothetical protein MJK04_23505, partial [Psychrosphaera sp.]|nr:hypothetical protein [Psychrosphaera sp.]
FTGTDGTLLIKKQQWQQFDQTGDCWFWAQKGEDSSAISYQFTQYHQRIISSLWTAQPVYRPGDLIKLGFVARTRSQAGMIAAQSIDDYDVVMTDRQSTISTVVELTELSKFGFAKGEVKTTAKMSPGTYHFYLVPKNAERPDYQRQLIGSVNLFEYIPPEFEVKLDAPEVLFNAQAWSAQLRANRLNGLPLKQAKVAMGYQLRVGGRVPAHWPEKYTYTVGQVSTDTNDQFKPLSKTQTLSFDDNGRLDYQAKLPNVDLPIGEVALFSKVTANDGEVQNHNKSIIYLGREHYIGTKSQYNHDKARWQVGVIGVDKNGVQLTDLVVSLEFYTQRNEQKQVLGQCYLTILPGLCDVPAHDESSVLVSLKSGEQNYRWQRSFWIGRAPVTKDKLAFLDYTVTVVAGQMATVKLNSPRAGTARFVVQTDQIKHTWQQNLVKGNNDITFDIAPGWGPQCFVQVVMYEPLAQGKLVAHSQDILELRIKPDKPALNVEVELVQSSIVSGQTLTMTLQSNHDADSQIWLVNDALWQQHGVSAKDFDLLAKSFKSNALSPSSDWARLNFESLTKTPRPPTIEYFSYDGLQQNSYGYAANSLSKSKPPAGSTSVCSQSVWLDLEQLKAAKKQIVEVKLPQLLGRWRMVVVSANDQQFAVNDKQITTTQAMEYFLDAPTTMLSVDSSKLSVMAINSLSVPAKREVTLFIDGKNWRTLTLNLTAGEQKQWVFDLPRFAIGEHTIHLTQGNDTDYLARSVIDVETSVTTKQLTWLYQPSDVPERILPIGFVPGSLTLKASPADSVSPDWLGLSDYNQNYTHQCWEQNISRALSYAYNPVAQSRWPQGQTKLNGLLSKAKAYQGFSGYFSYFASGKQDPFLTAYTALVQHWLKNQSLVVSANNEPQFKILTTLAGHSDSSVLERSMALLAAAVNGDIDKTETVALRQDIGRGSAYAQALQIIALNHVKADAVLLKSAKTELLDTGYQDLGVSILNDNAKRCFTVLALGDTHPRSQQLMAQVLKSQQKQRHFGSTFANGVCSYLFTDRLVTPSNNGVESQALDFTLDQQHLKLKSKPAVASYLQLDYLQDYRQMDEQAQGVTISRHYYVLKGEWQKVGVDDELSVDDIVKVELTVESPTRRQHMAIVDYVPGAFEVVNERFKNQFKDTDNKIYTPNLQIQKGRVNIYPYSLEKGETVFRYYAKVRSQGRFLAPGPEAQMMYQPSVWARGMFEWIGVSSYDQ